MLYGKGRNVYLNYQYLKGQTQFQIVGILTPDADQLIDPAIPMYYPDQLKTITPDCYDKVIITVRDQAMGVEMYQTIREAGVDEKKIVAAHIYLGPAIDISLEDFIGSPIRLRQEIEQFINRKYGNLHYFDPLIKKLKMKKGEHDTLCQRFKEVSQSLSVLENITFLYVLYLADFFDAELMKSLMNSALKIDQPELRNFLHGICYDTISMTFLHEEYFFPEYYVLRRSLIKKLCEMYHFHVDTDRIRKNRDGIIRKILIVVGSLRNHKHAPTLVAMQLSTALAELGYEVRIMPLDTDSNISWEFPVFRPVHGLAYYGSREFEEYQNTARHQDVTIEYTDIIDPEKKMQSELDKLFAFSPDLIIDRGAEATVFSCIYSKYFPTLCLSSSGCQSSSFFTYYGVIDHSMFMRANEVFHAVEYEKEVTCPLSHVIPRARTQYERGRYPWMSLEKDDFILISVGNRIGMELTKDFIDVICERLLTKKNIKWLIAGGTSDYLSQQYLELLKLNKIVYIPYEDDLPALYQICDVYLSPRRRGGGTSVFWAMYYGLPIAQAKSPQADAIAILGEENVLGETDEQIVSRILDMWEDPQKYRVVSDKTRARALHIEATQKQAWKDFLNELEIKQKQNNCE